MKAIQVHSYGHSDLIRIEDAPTPRPQAGEVLVRIRAAGVNPVDWKTREGYLKDVAPSAFPLILGQDFSGEIVELGSGVTDFNVGDAVMGIARGSYAEFAAVPIAAIAKKPESIDFESAATLPTPALTAYQIVVNVIRPSKGQTLLIHGAGGAVGAIATQLALSRGARVIATASSDDAYYLKALGVDQVIDYRSERFEDKTGAVDAVLDLVGGEVASRSIGVIKPGGVLVTTVGPLNESEAAQRQVRAEHTYMSPNAADLAEIANLVDQGILNVHLGRVLPLTRAKEALDSIQNGLSHGKVVLKVA